MPDFCSQLQSLLRTHYGREDVVIDESHPDFRLNLHPESIELWNLEYEKSPYSEVNLFLACTSSCGPIEDTALTWVVGSAVRHVKVKSRYECAQLLQVLGLNAGLAKAVTHNCPGIAEGVTWALYYERHGNLVATPVLSTGFGKEVLNNILPISC